MNKGCLTLVALSLFLAGCHYSRGLDATDKAVDQFHDRFNEKEFEKIFDQASNEFKQAYDKKKSLKHFKKIYDYLGKVERTKRGGWAVDIQPFGLEVTANFETAFERGSGKEKFVFLVGDEKVELMIYEFSSEGVELD